MFSFFKNNNKKQSGFTLIEVVIVLAIIILIAGISITNYNQVGKEIELDNAAYALALSVREAQVFGINSRDTGGNAFNQDPYGVYFQIDNAGSSSYLGRKKFLTFVDSLNNYFFDEIGTSGNCISTLSLECVSIYTTAFTTIKSMCVGDSVSSCADTKKLAVSFKRPAPDAIIKTSVSSGNFAFARLYLTDEEKDLERCVDIQVSGSITVSRCS